MNMTINLDLSGRHALVCGASRGIGAATAAVLAAHGAAITLLARDESKLAEVVRSLPQVRDGSHGVIACDHNDAAALKTAVDGLVATRGPVHVLVNNSGGPPAGTALDADAAAYVDAFRQHLVASQVLVQTLVGGMRDAGYGRIVNVISTSVREPIPGLGVSNTVRGAMASWAKTLSRELGPDGITVNNVLPGYTQTERLDYIFELRAKKSGGTVADAQTAARREVPLGRFADPHEIGGAVAWLASPAGAYVSGVSLAVDGGRTRCL